MPSNPAFLCEGAIYCADCITFSDSDLSTGHVSLRPPSSLACDDQCTACGETFARDSQVDLDAMVEQYLETLLWSESDEEGSLEDRFEPSDIPAEVALEIREDCENCLELAGHLLTEDEEQDSTDVGHNFCLTRNGHGAGFWDGGYEHGNALTEVAKTFGTNGLYVGDDGLLYTHS